MNPWSGAVQRRSFRQGGALPFQCASDFSHVADLPEAMYATIGYIVPEYYKFPGYLSPSLGLKFADVPNGLAALSKPSAYLQAAHAAHAMSFHISFEFQHLCRCKEQNGWR